MDASDKVLGLDVGGTKCAALVGTASDGQILERCEWPSQTTRGPEAMIADLIRNARSLLDRHADVDRMGVSIGGPLDAERGVILSPPNLPGWDKIALSDRLANALGVAVTIEHDATACALAEYRWGAGCGGRRVIYLTCGTGFGMGFVIDGRPYRGAGGRPSDVGHVRYREEGPVAYGRRGSLEAYCAASALGPLAAWYRPARWGEASPTSPQLAELARAGDPDAQAVLAINADAVGDACAMLADILYPDRILLGSLATYLGDAWLLRVRSRFAEAAYASASCGCIIAAAGLGHRLQDCSALAAASRSFQRGEDE